MRILFFCLLFLPPALCGQSLVENEVWSAEIEQDWVVDIPSLETEGDSGINTLKLIRTVHTARYVSSPFLADLFFHALIEEKIPVFKDAALTIPANPFEVFPGSQTMITFDPETYEEKIQIVHVHPYPVEDFKVWRLRQRLSYHRKNDTWSTEVLAIAPMIVARDDNSGDSTGLRALCWFRPENTRPDIASGDIVWAKMTAGKQHKTKVPVALLSPPAAPDSLPELLVCLKNMLENDMEAPLYNQFDDKLLDADERRSLISFSDTVLHCFTEGPNGAGTSVVHYDLMRHIRHLQLVQTWYWDERRHRLSICLDAVAPMQDVFDNEGNFRYSRPVYYRRTKN